MFYTGLASLHPHAAQWEAVHGLVADGVAFSRVRMQQGGATGGGAVGRAGGVNGEAAKTRKDTKVKTKEKKKEKKGGSGGEQTLKDALLASEMAIEVVASASRDPSSKETQAGGGGKWVHVPV